MARFGEEVVVTHSYAPDPDRAKVKAALDLWARSLAEQLRAASKETTGQEKPLPIAVKPFSTYR